MNFDSTALRTAIAIHANAAGWAHFGPVLAAYRTLTPGGQGAPKRGDIEANPDFVVEVVSVVDGVPTLRVAARTPGRAPNAEERLRLAVAYATHNPWSRDGWLEWGALSGGLKALAPDITIYGFGRDLKAGMKANESWRFRTQHNALLVRHLPPERQARRIDILCVGDRDWTTLRDRCWSLANAVGEIHQIDCRMATSGTRLRTVCLATGATDLVVAYDRPAKLWRDSDGHLLPTVHYVLNRVNPHSDHLVAKLTEELEPTDTVIKSVASVDGRLVVDIESCGLGDRLGSSGA